ncbi:gamma-glutamylcyclotransferase family protein [Dinghuibacter silviterrae]|uniref:Gamma-glutamylcyclotransferase (GGCT)/AIG2-like uncharacterized protein YtfP n=1 Tax=Dinghuibacter silviterrae TaxID=1539049 RepID=A0A4R8DGZ9_9BACT|nr:gamma-glutamylcyclotransferase family protein [Dinghuibacter silviterrae]TDW96386.1 gamma-glutamylcyclotransferase (GGCT)/AIG2-like uncharacterized protein YtfP [Dinghuibacter silviterrae]
MLTMEKLEEFECVDGDWHKLPKMGIGKPLNSYLDWEIIEDLIQDFTWILRDSAGDELIRNAKKKLDDNAANDEVKLFLKVMVVKRMNRTYLPERSLIVYGSLAPGRPNHHIVEYIAGTWRQGFVLGKLEDRGWGAGLGYLGFRPADEGDRIPVFVLTSEELADHWPRLDEFEGEEYKRLLAPFELDDGELGVGYIYAINE